MRHPDQRLREDAQRHPHPDRAEVLVRNLTKATLLAAASSAVLIGCGSSGDGDAATTGARVQAVERLDRYGLTKAQAACVTDELGAQVVVETQNLDALVHGADYRDAMRRCRDAS